MPRRAPWALLPLVEVGRKVELTLQQTRNYPVRSLGEPRFSICPQEGSDCLTPPHPCSPPQPLHCILRSRGLGRGACNTGVQSLKPEGEGRSTAVPKVMWQKGGGQVGLDVEADRTGGERAAQGGVLTMEGP